MQGLFSDSLNLLSGMTGRKAWNAAQVWSSYWSSRLSHRPDHRGWPISVSIEPTTSCNLRCPECPSGLRSFNRPTGMLEEGLFKSVIDQLSPTLTYLTFYFQGEPFLHPRFVDMVAYASSMGIYAATSTNAHFLSEQNCRDVVRAGLDRLVIS